MAGKEELDIVLNPDGSVRIHVQGIKGKKCTEIMKKLEKEFGSIREQRFTSEYYEQETESQIHRRI